jgi:hypothetical protein
MLHLYLKFNREKLEKRDKIKKKKKMYLQLKTPGSAKYRFVSGHPGFWTGYFPLNI